MYIELKADDVMPFGKYIGITLRSVYKLDIAYFNKICSRTQDYKISDRTKSIVKKDLPELEKSHLSFSVMQNGKKSELEADDKIVGGPFNGKTLYEIFLNNESYYRYLCTYRNYISKETLDELIERKYPSKKVKNTVRSRDEYQEIIEKEILKLEKGIDQERDLPNYIGNRITGKLSTTYSRTVNAAIRKDKYKLTQLLKKIYGENATFRDNQDKAIVSVLEGKKTLVVQRTGWGKSLVYFMSIMKLREMGKGPAIIISPLIALMRNQIKAVQKSNFKIDIREITSENENEWGEIYGAIKADKIDAILIAPEKLTNYTFKTELENVIPHISLLVIDEAHCISDWGHDFRVSFRRIVKFINELSPNVSILATTATANDRVVRDIRFQLGKDLEVLRGSMERDNFYIDILKLGNKSSKLSWLNSNLPTLIETGSGIIYCLTVKDCIYVSNYLRQNGFNAKEYYARIDSEDKRTIEQDFIAGKYDVIVATIAYGMGIDNDNISFVIHFSQPAGIIAYYQQIGRAGRKKEIVPKAYAIMLVGDDDNDTNIYFITHAFPTATDLTKAIDYVTENPECSRHDLMDEFKWNQDKAEKEGLSYLFYKFDDHGAKAHGEWSWIIEDTLFELSGSDPCYSNEQLIEVCENIFKICPEAEEPIKELFWNGKYPR